MSTPLVSVILPVYNMAKYLPESIGSALSQTFTDFELLILDNASTDNSPDVIGQFLDPRITSIRHEENLGFAGNMSFGLDRARGKYVTALGADDIWADSFLAKAAAFLDAHPSAGLVHSDAIWIDGESNPYGESAAAWAELTPAGEAVIDCFRLGFCFATVMWRANVLEAAGGFEVAWGPPGDLYLFLRLAMVAETGYIPENLAWYRQHQGNLSTQMFAGVFGGMLQINLDALRIARQWPAARSLPSSVWERTERSIAMLNIRMLHLSILEGQRGLWAAAFVRTIRLSPGILLLPQTWLRLAIGLLPRRAIGALQKLKQHQGTFERPASKFV